MQRHEPDPAADERTALEQFLDCQRATVADKTDGLTGEQLGRHLPTSALSLAGLLKHLALVEDSWFQERFLGRQSIEPWADAPWDQDPDWEFHSAEHDDPDELRALYRAACERSRQAIVGADLDDLAAVGPGDGRPRSLRWTLLHLIEETARHAGHIDLLREAVDGMTGE